MNTFISKSMMERQNLSKISRNYDVFELVVFDVVYMVIGKICEIKYSLLINHLLVILQNTD